MSRYDVPEVVKYVDFLNVMTYDFHGHWEGEVGHNSPLYPLESASNHQRKLTMVNKKKRSCQRNSKSICNVYKTSQDISCRENWKLVRLERHSGAETRVGLRYDSC